ncbi:MAG: hypothetical protein EOO89_18435 [Pedobacter sp.]|nr:MAG: hypothetical protein EOO89_18435 [Pedobacter sp.]
MSIFKFWHVKLQVLVMKAKYALKGKMKIAVLLFAVMVSSLLIRLLEDQGIKDMNRSVRSMYNDRLMPSVYLHQVGEHVHAKRNAIETALNTGGSISAELLKEELRNINGNIDSLIAVYNNTFLVPEEQVQLTELKKNMAFNRNMEQQFVARLAIADREGAALLYERSVGRAALTTLGSLSKLIGIQARVGKELLGDMDFAVSGNKFYSALQTVLAIIIGLLIVSVVSAYKITTIQNDKFRLN